jgi:hypothetical protein
MSTTMTTDPKPSFKDRLPDFKPTFFRLFFGISVFVISLLLQLHLANDGILPVETGVGWASSAILGLLAYWLSQSIVMFFIAFTPVIAIIAGLIALYGWLSH